MAGNPLRSSWGRALLTTANPIWKRELRYLLRQSSTARTLGLATLVANLVVCGVADLGRGSEEPAEIGWVTFQAAFTVAYLVVVWVGPRAAAAVVAGEGARGGWDLLSLSPLSTRAVARGKFLAALTHVSLYLTVLAPTFALPCLFGGVSLLEILFGYVLLYVFAAIVVSIALAISSYNTADRRTRFPSAPTIMALGAVVYLGGGVGLSLVANQAWFEIPSGFPLWLPTAWYRVAFDFRALTTLVYAPAAIVSMTTWFFYEVTVLNLSVPKEHQPPGLRRWFVVTLPGLVALFLVPCSWLVEPHLRWMGYALACTGISWHVAVCLYLFALAPPGARSSTGLTYLGACTGLGLLTILATAWLDSVTSRSHFPASQLWCIASVAAYGFAFTVFLLGFTRHLRVRGRSPAQTRRALLGACFGTTVAPILTAACAQLLLDPGFNVVWLAAPSPGYAFVVADQILSGHADERLLLAAAIAVCLWFLLGLGLWFTARAKTVTPLDTVGGKP
jgi:hypothetical protein